eukprot:COSAG04_NODE_29240_length_270_cov_0.865497_1_plen_57_part_01
MSRLRSRELLVRDDVCSTAPGSAAQASAECNDRCALTMIIVQARDVRPLLLAFPSEV